VVLFMVLRFDGWVGKSEFTYAGYFRRPVSTRRFEQACSLLKVVLHRKTLISYPGNRFVVIIVVTVKGSRVVR